MALPTTVASEALRPGEAPPFLSSGGNVYVIAGAAGDTGMAVWKATDPTSSFTEQDTANNPAAVMNIQVISAVQEGDVIHIATAALTGLHTLAYHTFNMATDAWVITDETIEAPNDVPTLPWISIAVPRSDGDVIVAYAGDTDQVMGGKKERVDYARREGGTWTAGVALDAAGDIHYGNPVIAKDSGGDKHHILWSSTDNTADPPTSWLDVEARSLSSTNTLSTVATTTMGTSQMSDHSHMVSFDDSGTEVMRIPRANGTIGAAIMCVADGSGDISFEATTVQEYAGGGFTPYAQDGSIAAHTFAYDSTEGLHVLWSNTDDSQDIYHSSSTDTGDTWASETQELDAVTCNYLSSNIYTRGTDTVLASVYDDGGTTKYNELVLSSAGTTISVTTVNLVLAEQTASISHDVTVNATTGALTLAEQTASITQNLAKTISATAVNLTLAEQAATVTLDHNISVSSVNLVLAEQNPNVNASKSVTATLINLTLAELDATVTQSAGATNVNVTTVGLVLAEADATVSQELHVNATSQNLVLAEQTASITIDRTRDVSVVNLVLAEHDASVSRAKIVTATSVNLTLAEQEATISLDRTRDVTSVSLILAEQSATISRELHVNATSIALTLAEQDVTLTRDRTRNVSIVNLVLTPQAVSVNAGNVIGITQVSLTLAEQDTTISLDRTRDVSTVNLVLAEHAASVFISSNIDVTTASLVLAEQPANVNLSRTISATSIALALAEQNAAILQARTISVGSVNLTLTEQPALVNPTGTSDEGALWLGIIF